MSDKTELRARFARVRDEMDHAARTKASHRIRHRVLALPELRSAQTVFCYVSVGNEVDTRELIDQLLDSDRTVAVPHLDDQGAMRPCVVRSAEELEPGRFGIPAPPGEPVLETTPDLSICPGLAFTRTGQRLGQGGGFYDRFLQTHSRTRTIGLAYEAQLTDPLPICPHDKPMDAVVTEQRVYLANGGSEKPRTRRPNTGLA